MATIWHHLQGQPEGQLEDGQRGAEPLPAEAERGPQEAARHHGPQNQVKERVLTLENEYRARLKGGPQVW